MSAAAETTSGRRLRLGSIPRIILAGIVIGVLTVGVLSRLAMFLLVRLNPVADGLRSDDDFEMGRFTAAGSFNLVVFGVFIGILSGLLYVAVERLRFGPGWFRTLSLSVGAGVVVSTQVVHSDGVDFDLLGPLWLAVGLFVAVPVVHVALLDRAAVRIREGQGNPAPSASGPVAWILRAALAALVVVALASLVSDVRALTG